MSIGDVSTVTLDGAGDLYCLVTGLYGTPVYGASYIFNTPRPTVIETSPGRNHELLLNALDDLSIGRADLRNIVLTPAVTDSWPPIVRMPRSTFTISGRRSWRCRIRWRMA